MACFLFHVVCYKMQSIRCGLGVKVEKFCYLSKVFFSSSYLWFLHNIFKLLCFIPIFMTFTRFAILQSHPKAHSDPYHVHKFNHFQIGFGFGQFGFWEFKTILGFAKFYFQIFKIDSRFGQFGHLISIKLQISCNQSLNLHNKSLNLNAHTLFQNKKTKKSHLGPHY